MGLVIRVTEADKYLEENLVVTGGQKTNYAVDGKTFLDVMTYPAQGDFAEPVKVMMIQKPFFDFAQKCGPKGAMTAEMITEKLPELDAAIAKDIADDFAIFYGNYVVIPEVCLLLLTASPVNSINDLMKPREDEAAAEEDK